MFILQIAYLNSPATECTEAVSFICTELAKQKQSTAIRSNKYYADKLNLEFVIV